MNTTQNVDSEADVNQIEDMLNRTIIAVKQDSNEDKLAFFLDNNTVVEFQHIQDCCESVYIESITGDFLDLIGNPLLVAEERITQSNTRCDSTTYTFYTFRTIKGSVDVRWVGNSNGYYSESVDWTVDEIAEPIRDYLQLLVQSQEKGINVWVSGK